MPFVVMGIYLINSPLSDTDYVQVPVQFNQPGKYRITTNELNGYSFETSGEVSDSGIVLVRLKGKGTPLVSGIDHFTISYNGGSCNFQVSVMDTIVPPAEFTMVGTPNACAVDSIFGNYAVGAQLDDGSAVRLEVNVTKRGSYTISTNEVNGYTFSAKGVFNATGVQSVNIYAQGRPLLPGENTFVIDTPATPCSFNITVIDTVKVTSKDYFPLTKGSYWSYEDLTNLGDTMMRRITDTMTINDKLYTVMNQQNKFGDPRTLFFFKEGDQYYEYAHADKYSGSLFYIPDVYGDIYFLNQVLFNGTTWGSDEYTGTIQGGQPIMLQYSFSCLDKDATVTFNGKAFAHVYMVRMQPYIRSLQNSYNSTGEDYYYFYARGIGCIYMLKLQNGSRLSEWRIKSWSVN
jgi:hypothetical protein